MAQYSGNLLSQLTTDPVTGALGTYGVAANYRRVSAPMSNFGTRQIMFLAIRDIDLIGPYPSDLKPVERDGYDLGNLDLNNYGAVNSSAGVVIPDSYLWKPDSALWQAINGVMLAAEVCFVGQPYNYNDSAWDLGIIVGVYFDTAASADSAEQHAYAANGMARTIQQAVLDATGQADIKVYPVFPKGIQFTNFNSDPTIDNGGHYGHQY
jgi:hypothetical protein